MILHAGRMCTVEPVMRWPQFEEARVPTQVLYQNGEPVGYAQVIDSDGDYEMSGGADSQDVVKADLFKLHFLGIPFSDGEPLSPWPKPAGKSPSDVMRDFLAMIWRDINDYIDKNKPSNVPIDSSTKRTLVLAHPEGVLCIDTHLMHLTFPQVALLFSINV